MDSILYEVVVSTKREVDDREDAEGRRKEPEFCGEKNWLAYHIGPLPDDPQTTVD